MKKGSFRLAACSLPLLICKLYSGCQPGQMAISDHKPVLKVVIARAVEVKDKGAFQEAVRLVDSVYQRERPVGPADRSQYYHLMAAWALERSQFKAADRYTDSALSILKPCAGRPGYDIDYGEAHLLKGDVFFEQGKYDSAFHYYFTSRKPVKEDSGTAYHLFTSHYWARIAQITYKQEQFKAAAGYYKKVLLAIDSASTFDFDTFSEKQGAFSNLASSYLRAGVPDSALKYYKMGLDLLNSARVSFPVKSEFMEMARGVNIGNMGDAWQLKGQFKEAENCYLEDIAINDRPGRYKQDALITKLKLADLYVKTAQLNKAALLLKPIGRSPVLANTENMINFLMTRANYEQATGDLSGALNDLRRRSTLRDSLEMYQRKLAGANGNNLFSSLEMDYQKKYFDKRDMLKTYLLYFSLVLGSMSLVIIVLLFKNNRASGKLFHAAQERNAEQQLTLHAFESSNNENGRLMGLLAHDIKNPVHAISTIATLMLATERTEDDKEMLHILKDSALKIDLIVNDILESGEHIDVSNLHIGNHDLAAVLRHSVSLLRFKAANKQQKIVKSSPKILTAPIDPHKLWRVFNNILVNAIKFSPENTTISVNLTTDEHHAVISIRDEGIGIPDELKEKLFLRAPEIKRVGTAGEDTFGIGLYTSKKIVEAQGGTLTFECPTEGGSIFIIKIPL